MTVAALLVADAEPETRGFLERNLPRIHEPSYFVFPTGDEDIFPSQFNEHARISTAEDKAVDWLPKYNHNLLLPGEASPDGARRRRTEGLR